MLESMVGSAESRAECLSAGCTTIEATPACLRFVVAIPNNGGRFGASGVATAGCLHFDGQPGRTGDQKKDRRFYHWNDLRTKHQHQIAAAPLDLDPDRLEMDLRSVEHNVIGNFMRLDSSSRIEVDERWRSFLTNDELEDFDRVAGDLNRRYGYT